MPTVSFQSWLPEEALVPLSVSSLQPCGYRKEMPSPANACPAAIDDVCDPVPAVVPDGYSGLEPPPPLHPVIVRSDARASVATKWLARLGTDPPPLPRSNMVSGVKPHDPARRPAS
jgi:hypothetical protein